MPTPLELLFDPISLGLICLYAALIVWEFMFPARTLPHIKYWPLRGILAFVMYFYLASYLPLLWDGMLAKHRLLDISAIHPAVQVVIGLVVYEFLVYWYHRAMHRFNFLWRGFHQWHHSAERLDTFGAFWLSPLDIAGFSLVSSFALVYVLGLDAMAATIVLFVLIFCSIFQHMNVKTPRWLGYFIQRPESHSHHHGRGVHRDNYADLPIMDMIFGTFRNPRNFFDTGFYHGASSRVIDMLLWREVDQPEPDQPAALRPRTF